MATTEEVMMAEEGMTEEVGTKALPLANDPLETSHNDECAPRLSEVEHSFS